MGKKLIIKGADFSQNGMHSQWEDCSNLLVFNQNKFLTASIESKRKAGDGMYDYYFVDVVLNAEEQPSQSHILCTPVDVSDATKIAVTICTATTSTYGNSLVIRDSNNNVLRRIVANEHSYKGTMLALIDLPSDAATIQFATWNPNGPDGEYATEVELYKFRS